MARHDNPHNRNGHRRRQLAARIKATATHCALCNQPLNPGATWPDPTCTVIDEDMPRVKGGNPLDPGNTNALHNRCNNWKGAMTLAEARALLQTGVQVGQNLSRSQRRKALNQNAGAWEPSSNFY